MPGQGRADDAAGTEALPEPPPVIYVTGSEESRIAVAALKAGAIDYVVKTIGEDFFDLLARAIDQALVQVSLRAEKERAETALRESNERLQAMLHEVNHRVANSLQLVSAFVHMQARNASRGRQGGAGRYAASHRRDRAGPSPPLHVGLGRFGRHGRISELAGRRAAADLVDPDRAARAHG
jgi:FixJ family two-component response regulator